MTALIWLAVDCTLAIAAAPWLPPLVGIYVVVVAGAVWVCHEWTL